MSSETTVFAQAITRYTEVCARTDLSNFCVPFRGVFTMGGCVNGVGGVVTLIVMKHKAATTATDEPNSYSENNSRPGMDNRNKKKG